MKLCRNAYNNGTIYNEQEPQLWGAPQLWGVPHAPSAPIHLKQETLAYLSPKLFAL